jgi:hypothetical protein
VNQPVDLAAAAKYEEIVRDLLINVADDPKPPQWKPDSFFRRYATESKPTAESHVETQVAPSKTTAALERTNKASKDTFSAY